MFFKKKKNIEQHSDSELIILYKQDGNNDVIGILFKRYTHLVLGVCLKYLKDPELSKDLVMQVFEKLLTSLKQHDIQNFKSWLHVTTRNECLMYLRKQKSSGRANTVGINDLEFMEYQLPVHHNGETIDLEEDVTRLEGCIDKLKGQQNTCIRLFYLEKKSYDEIVEQTGFELKKVKSYLQNGRRNLKICIEQKRERA